MGGPSASVQNQGISAARSIPKKTAPNKTFNAPVTATKGRYRRTSVEIASTIAPCAKNIAERERARYSKMGWPGISPNPSQPCIVSIHPIGKKIGKKARQIEPPIILSSHVVSFSVFANSIVLRSSKRLKTYRQRVYRCVRAGRITNRVCPNWRTAKILESL